MFVLLWSQNLLIAGATVLLLGLLLFGSLNLVGTLMLHRDRLIRHSIGRGEAFTAYWFFADAALFFVSAVAAFALRNGGLTWIAITCGLAGAATAIYGIKANLPDQLPRSYRAQRLIATFGLCMTLALQVAALAMGVVMAANGRPGVAALMTMQHDLPLWTRGVILPLLMLLLFVNVMTFTFFLLSAAFFTMARTWGRKAMKRSVHA